MNEFRVYNHINKRYEEDLIMVDKDVLPLTVFDKITESAEKLAEEFVDALYDRVACEYRYYSMLTAEFYDTRAEALIATIVELKKECNG
jgi:hypothetical protein